MEPRGGGHVFNTFWGFLKLSSRSLTDVVSSYWSVSVGRNGKQIPLPLHVLTLSCTPVVFGRGWINMVLALSQGEDMRSKENNIKWAVLSLSPLLSPSVGLMCLIVCGWNYSFSFFFFHHRTCLYVHFQTHGSGQPLPYAIILVFTKQWVLAEKRPPKFGWGIQNSPHQRAKLSKLHRM